MDKYLTTKEASEYLGYSEGHLRLLCRRGLLPHTQMANGGKILFDKKELDKLLHDPQIQIRAGGVSSMSLREYNAGIAPDAIAKEEGTQYR